MKEETIIIKLALEKFPITGERYSEENKKQAYKRDGFIAGYLSSHQQLEAERDRLYRTLKLISQGTYLGETCSRMAQNAIAGLTDKEVGG